LLLVAGRFTQSFDVKIVDLNLDPLPPLKGAKMYGLKVSSQNFSHAVDISQKLRTLDPSAKIVWGGELPTLLPEKCLEYADSIFGGLFEPVADNFIADLTSNTLQQRYFGENAKEQTFSNPDFSLLPGRDKYYRFMGFPLETSRGCTEKCIFCMVHTMQKKNYNLSGLDHLKDTISQYKGEFINVVDYNFGVDAAHVVQVSALIKASGAVGWMAEMCIELLDNDEVLDALRDSNCKMVYCGLESIDQQSLNSVHKMNTNHIQNYERIIRKVQSYGVQVAAGIILGLEGTHPNTFEELYKFYQRMGIIYAKLTFLTYNPGTKVHEYVKKKGGFLTEETDRFDGNQLTYLPNGVDAGYVARGTKSFIENYYSVWGITKRSFNTSLGFMGRLEFILFNLCYRKVYLDWLEHDTLQNPQNLKLLLDKPFKKNRAIKMIERALHTVRIIRMS